MPRSPQWNWITCGVLAFLLAPTVEFTVAQEPEKEATFLDAVRRHAEQLRQGDAPPQTLADWKSRRKVLRKRLEAAWGAFPKTHAGLNARVLGVLKREGYRVEKVVFQTWPGVWMTANAYVPEGEGRFPAVLCVHGHWRGAKQDPHVQSRCIGLAKLGFFVLAVDAFGAGERGVGKALGEYHGEMVGATLLPIGRPLAGLQVYENMRAVDYLLTRPEVKGDRIGITGASGGGNQTMYAAAWDERLQVAVPVCSVGSFQAYLGAACCMCEVVPGVLDFTEESGVLGLVAPRPLMIVSATRDAFQFSVGEAKKSLAGIRPIYKLYDADAKVRHAIFEAPHDYNREMREAMYGWMTLHLKGVGDGGPIDEPKMTVEPQETLRCFPGESRPNDFLTLPQFAYREGVALRARIRAPKTRAQWRTEASQRAKALEQRVLRGTRPAPRSVEVVSKDDARTEIRFRSQMNTSCTGTLYPAKGSPVLLLALEGEADPKTDPYAKAIVDAGHALLTLNLRATGSFAHARDKIGRAPDHNSAEWGLLLGRPMLGQWVQDVRAFLSVLEGEQVELDGLAIVGKGPAGLVAISAAVVDERVRGVVVADSLASFLTDAAYEGQRLGVLAPGVVRDVGDVAHLAALIAPRPVLVAGAVRGDGAQLTPEQLDKEYDYTRRVYSLLGQPDGLQLASKADPGQVAKRLKGFALPR